MRKLRDSETVRDRILAASIGLALVATVGCSPTSVPEPPPGTLGDVDSEATLITVVTTVPSEDELPAAIAASVARRVPEVIGVVFDREQIGCAADGIVDETDADALREMGLGGLLQEQPLDLQAAVFTVFDRCVGPTDYARIAAPILVNAGAQQPVAECVFREMRAELGFVGLYAFAVQTAGGAPPDDELREVIADSYAACDLDPANLSVPLGPPTTLAPGASTTSPTTSTTLAPDATPVTIASTTVVPPVAPPEDAVVTTTRAAVASTAAASEPTTAG